jgi:hypothetical protein
MSETFWQWLKVRYAEAVQPIASWWAKISQPWRYVLLISSSLFLSCAGVIWAVSIKSVSDGGRGGALAAVVALCAIFLRPDYGIINYQKNEKHISEAHLSEIHQLIKKHEALVKAIKINSDGQTHQNRALVIASIIGTIFWGFGDKFATWLQPHWMA